MAKQLTKPKIKLLISAVVLLIVGLLQMTGTLEPVVEVASETQPGLYKVTEIVDGDTIKVDMNGIEETIRLIGIDTPETKDPRKQVQCFGAAASNFVTKLIGDNNVRLEADPINTNRDRYNRLLRYVYLPDNTMVNGEVIKQGYGFAYTNFPFTKVELFRSLQTEARENNRGLWSECRVEQKSNGQINTIFPGDIVN